MSTSERIELPGFVVNWAARLFGRAFARRLAAIDASMAHWPVLLTLTEEPGLTQAELARRLDLEQPTVANTLKRMERDGLVLRQPDPRDRRQAQVYLTEDAKRLLPRMRSIADEVNAQALEGFSAHEREMFFVLLHRVIDNLRRDVDEHPSATSRGAIERTG